MIIQSQFPLQVYNTFGIQAYAKYFSAFSNETELMEMLYDKGMQKEPKFILGGGSNILLTKDIDALVLKNEWMGIEKIHEKDNQVWIRVGGGVVWHDLVMYAVANGLGGIENMALIPGTVGAAPIQNIGAYGVELKDVFDSLDAIHIQDRVHKKFDHSECNFGYRESVFKHQEKGSWIITSVTLRLNNEPTFNISYGAIGQELERMEVSTLSLLSVATAVMNIRRSKLPDPKQIGNSGSFFKNPEISATQYMELKKQFPGLVAYAAGNQYKLAAGWLIEQCGWKGYRKGDAGCHEKQALVLVNYGHASGHEILSLSEKIIQSVYEKFGVTLEREVNLI